MDDLEALEPSTRSASYRGERLVVRPLAIGMVPKIIRLARPVVSELIKFDDLPADGSEEMILLVIDLVERHADSLFAAVSIAIDRDQAWIEGGDTAEFLELAIKLFEVNRDFFAQRLAPLLEAAKTAARTGRGPTPSSSLSSAATPLPTSAVTRSGSYERSRKPQRKRGAGT